MQIDLLTVTRDTFVTGYFYKKPLTRVHCKKFTESAVITCHVSHPFFDKNSFQNYVSRMCHAGVDPA
jgi:hypothetical protein